MLISTYVSLLQLGHFISNLPIKEFVYYEYSADSPIAFKKSRYAGDKQDYRKKAISNTVVKLKPTCVKIAASILPV